MRRRDFLKTIGIGAASLALPDSLLPAAPQFFENPTPGALNQGNSVTFFAITDPHVGYNALTNQNSEDVVNIMNDFPGTSYPEAIGGTVDAPIGVLLPGDLTNIATQSEWDLYTGYYGLDGTDGLLNYPVYECLGNHDHPDWVTGGSTFVANAIDQRRGRTYSMDWGPVKMICVGIYPKADHRVWLAQQLAAVGIQKAVILFFHFNLEGLHSEYWTAAEKELFRQTINGYNIIGIITGHAHSTYKGVWNGYDIYGIGSPCDLARDRTDRNFAIFKITNDQMSCAVRYWPPADDPYLPGPYWRDDLTHVKSITTI